MSITSRGDSAGLVALYGPQQHYLQGLCEPLMQTMLALLIPKIHDRSPSTSRLMLHAAGMIGANPHEVAAYLIVN